MKLARLLPDISVIWIDDEEAVMKSLIGAALVAGALMVAGSGAVNSAAAPQARTQSAGTSEATDFSAHRYVRRHHRHDGYSRPYYRPHYYNRPVYYRPYPYYAPAPFTFGIGFGPVWW